MTPISKSNPTPLYIQVRENLRQQIYSGELQPGSAIPDERSLSEELGLSRMTVRRAIMDLTEEGLFERVRGRGTFVLEIETRPTPTLIQKDIKVALVSFFDQGTVPESTFYFSILQGIHDVSQSSGISIAYHKISKPFDPMIENLKHENSLDAIMVIGVVDQELLQKLAGLGYPLLLVDTAQIKGGPLFDQVGVGSEESSFDAVTSLIELGHRDIALMVHSPITAAGRSRKAGYERAFQEKELPIPEDMIFPTACDSESAYAAAQQMLTRKKIPTAVFCTSNEIAVGLMAGIKDHGWRIPEQMSVIGFGDARTFTSPALSLAKTPSKEIGIEAARLLCDRLNNPDAPPQRRILESTWTPRASCGKPRSDNEKGSSPI